MLAKCHFLGSSLIDHGSYRRNSRFFGVSKRRRQPNRQSFRPHVSVSASPGGRHQARTGIAVLEAVGLQPADVDE